MKTIKVAFVDFWAGCDIENHIICKALKLYYCLEFVEPNRADYVFFSVFGNEHWFLPDDTVKIFYTGENLFPDFNICDYAIGFDWIDVDDRYIRLPNYYATDFFLKKVELMQQKHKLDSEKNYFDRDFCSFVVSNSTGNPIRGQVFEKLSNYKKVDSGGKWMNNVDGPVKDKLLFEKTHKFSICFENESHPGYTTEKIIEAYAAQTIPIYWGDPLITKVFNPYSFINVNEVHSLDELVSKVEQIDNDKELYMKMLMTPALKDISYSYESRFHQLSEFLRNIIEQPISSAKRYNRLCRISKKMYFCKRKDGGVVERGGLENR